MSKEYREYIDFDNTISINGETFDCIGAFAVVPYGEYCNEINDFVKAILQVSLSTEQSSCIIFNMKFVYIKNECFNQDIPWFLYCYMSDDEICCERWDVDFCRRGRRKKIYTLIEKSSVMLTGNNVRIPLQNKNSSLSIDLSVLRKANDYIKRRLYSLMKRLASVRSSKEELTHATNDVGIATWYYRKGISGNGWIDATE